MIAVVIGHPFAPTFAVVLFTLMAGLSAVLSMKLQAWPRLSMVLAVIGLTLIAAGTVMQARKIAQTPVVKNVAWEPYCEGWYYYLDGCFFFRN